MRSQEIGFCHTADGVGLAFARSGLGPPLVKTAHFLTHVELDWDSPLWKAWWSELGAHHQLVRFDQRGCGLSDRAVDRFDLDAWVTDLETVVDFLGLDRFPLLGMSQGGPVAIAYAARHPERVSHLVLYGSYVRGTNQWPGFDPVQAEAMRTLVETGWVRCLHRGDDQPLTVPMHWTERTKCSDSPITLTESTILPHDPGRGGLIAYTAGVIVTGGSVFGVYLLLRVYRL